MHYQHHSLRAGLYHSEEVLWSRIVGERSNTFDYGVGSLWPRLLRWRTSDINEKNDMLVNMATLFARGVSPKVKFLGQTLGQET